MPNTLNASWTGAPDDPRQSFASTPGPDALSVHHDEPFEVWCEPIARPIQPRERVEITQAEYDEIARNLTVFRLAPAPKA